MNILGIFLLITVLAACGSPEEREARHLAKGIEYYEEGNNEKAMVEFRNALRINPKNAETLYHVGLLHERMQRWPQAFAAYQAAAAERPGYIDANLKLGTLGLMSGNIELAEQSAQTILESSPENLDGQVLDAASMLRRGDLQRAQDIADAVLATEPLHENAIAVMVGVLQARGQHDEAVEKLDGALSQLPDNINLRVLKIAILEQSEQTEGIREVYEELITLEPQNSANRLALSEFLNRQGDFPGARAILTQAIDDDIAIDEFGQALISLIYREEGFEAARDELDKLIAANPKNYRLYFLKSEMMSREGLLADAEAALDPVIESAGTEAAEDAGAAKARLRFMQGDVETARSLSEGILEENAEHRGANLVLGMVQLQEGEFDEAIRSGRTALRRDPAWTPGLKLVAEGHLRKNELDLAIDTLNTVVAVDPKDADSGAALARLLTQRGDLDAALKIWDQLLASGADPAIALQARAQIRMQQENWMAAQSDIDSLLAIPGQELTGSLLAGDLMVAQNRLDQGREWFDRALALEPEAHGALLGFVRTFVAEGDVDSALSFLDQRIAVRSDDALAHNIRGELLAGKGEAEAANTAFHAAIEAQPQWMTPYRQLVRLQRSEADIDGAVATYESALQHSPDNPVILRDLASTLLNAQRYADAIDVYDKIIAMDPEDDVSANNYAALIADYRYDDSDILAKAIAAAQRFRTSDNGWFLDTLGWLHYRNEDFAVAVTFLERAANQLPDNPQISYHLGMALKASGVSERAKLALAKAVADGADYHGIEEARAALTELEAAARAPGTEG